MALADLTHPVAIAEAIIRQLGLLSPPIPIYDIALDVGIVAIEEVAVTGFAGALVTRGDEQTGVILVTKGVMPERTRFTVGHELGHFLVHWHHMPEGGFQCTAQDMRTPMEKGLSARLALEGEANAFSAEILMPKTLFSAALKKMADPGLEHVCDLATRYETSKLATARRFISLHGDPMGLVVSKDGVVEQVYRENGFPYISLKKGQAIHRACVASTFSGNRDECSNTDAVESTYWLADSLSSGRELFEQVLVQGSGYKITLLSVNDGDEDSDDETEERSRFDPKFAYGR